MNAVQTISSKVLSLSEAKKSKFADKFVINKLEKCEDKEGNELPEELTKLATDYAGVRASQVAIEESRRQLESKLVKEILDYNENELKTELSNGVKSIRMPDIGKRITISEKQDVEFDAKELSTIASRNNVLDNVLSEHLNVKALSIDWLRANLKEGVTLDGIVEQKFDFDKFMKLVDTEIIPVEELLTTDESSGEVTVAITPKIAYGVMFAELKETKEKKSKKNK